jgi:hypothetical protein
MICKKSAKSKVLFIKKEKIIPSPNRKRTRTGAPDAVCGDGVRGGE